MNERIGIAGVSIAVGSLVLPPASATAPIALESRILLTDRTRILNRVASEIFPSKPLDSAKKFKIFWLILEKEIFLLIITLMDSL